MGTFSVRKTTEQFIAEAKDVHGDKYDYSKVEYKNNHDKVCIICPIHGEFWQYPKDHLLKSGCKKCYQCSKSKYGVAICDIPNCSNNNYYNTWRAMLNRVFGRSYKISYPSYKNSAICNEWLTLSKFKEWFDDPNNGYIEGYHLDKDILIKGNKLYSPNHCCFVPSEINTLFSVKHKRNDLPIGVTNCGNKYKSQFFDGKNKLYLGVFSTTYDAFNAYKKVKERHIKNIAEKYFQEGKITEKVYNALMKYEVEITD